VVEGGGLENRCSSGNRGFESLPLRHFQRIQRFTAQVSSAEEQKPVLHSVRDIMNIENTQHRPVSVKTLQRGEPEDRMIPLTRSGSNRRLDSASQLRAFIGWQQPK
jgi:hypothetical protein